LRCRAWPRPSSGQDAKRGLDQAEEMGYPAGGEGAVDRTVIDREGHSQHRGDADGAVGDDCLGAGGADGEDRRLGRVDDSAELLDAEAAEAGDGESAAL